MKGRVVQERLREIQARMFSEGVSVQWAGEPIAGIVIDKHVPAVISGSVDGVPFRLDFSSRGWTFVCSKELLEGALSGRGFMRTGEFRDPTELAIDDREWILCLHVAELRLARKWLRAAGKTT